MGRFDETSWVIMYGAEWNFLHNNQMMEYARMCVKLGKKVLFVKSLPIHNIPVRKVGAKTFLIRIYFRFRKQLKLMYSPEKNIVVFNPIFFPNMKREKLNSILLKIQIRFLIKLFRMERFALLIFSPIIDLKIIFPHKEYTWCILRVGDIHSDHRDVAKEVKMEISAYEDGIFEVSDAILTVSLEIYNKIKMRVGSQKKVYYIPHGVNFHHFTSNQHKCKIMEGIAKPIGGYFGTITHNNNQEILIELAKAGYNVVMIGPVLGDHSRAKRYNNIKFLGPINYQDIPSYASYFDVCIMNWKMSEWIRNCNPVKTLEYLALGKPVVSVPIPELKRRFGDVIYFADNPKEFVKQCNKAIQEDNNAKRTLRQNIAKKHRSNKQFDEIKEVLNGL